MRSCIRRLFSYSVLVLIAAILLLPLYGAAYARSSKAGHYTIFGEIVGADPGEDPHLNFDPPVDPELFPDFDGGASSTTADGADTALMGGHQVAGCKAVAGRTRAKTKLLITMQILFGPLFR